MEGNLPPIPDSQKFDPNDERVTIKPEEVKIEQGDTEHNAAYGTKSQEGDKNLSNKDYKQDFADEPSTATYIKALES